MKKKHFKTLLFTILGFLVSCSNTTEPANQDPLPHATVEVSPVITGDIQDYLVLNGKTIYLKKNSIVSPISGYVQKLNVEFGDHVQKNDVLFVIETKERKALENMGILEDNAGIINILSPSSGIVNELNINETGGYIVEGTPLGTIVENKYLMVQVNVPFENNKLINTGTRCKISLTDNTQFDGVVYQILPIIDEISQTQKVFIKPVNSIQLPENLNLSVRFINTKNSHSILVPKEAVMTNETQDIFWVMKLTADSLAIKLTVEKGIESGGMVEIISGNLFQNDLVISRGAYGLPDSTLVSVK